MLKKYWDIISGILASLLIVILADFKLQTIQLCYSIIILTLVSIGMFRIIKQAAEGEKKDKGRKHNIVDSIIDGQRSIKAVSLAQAPTEEGEKIGKTIINIWEDTKKTMKNFKEKVKTFWGKFKGYMLTIALAILTIIELCGAPINALCKGALTVKGVEILPLVTLACAIVVGLISNGFTKEQREKIKALFSKSTTNELVKEEIKKTIKEKSAQLTQFNKLLSTQEHELANFNSELETLNNTLQAKREMYTMIPQLATAEDVQLANNAVVGCNAKIADKKAEIAKTKETIGTLTTTINALKNQL